MQQIYQRKKRVTKEMKDFKQNALKQLQLIQYDDKQFQNAVFAFSGAIDTPYEGYWFKILVQWPQDYPMRPFKVRLLNKIWNPYVNFQYNSICIDILKDQFSPCLTTEKILLSIISLLSETKTYDNHEGFANPKAASQMMNNYPYFYNEAKKLCQIYSWKRKNIYNDSQRGMGENHFIKAEGKDLQDLIEQESKNPSMRKAYKLPPKPIFNFSDHTNNLEKLKIVNCEVKKQKVEIEQINIEDEQENEMYEDTQQVKELNKILFDFSLNQLNYD